MMAFDLASAKPTIKTGFDLSSAKPATDPRMAFMENVSPTERVLAGAGKAFMDIGRGVGQRLGLIPQEAIEEAQRLDWPLMQTGAGITGNVIGNVAAALPTMAIPGAGTATGSALIGAGLGALQPTGTDESALANAALGGAFGAGGALIPRGLARIVNPKATQTIAQAKGITPLTPGQALGGAFKTSEEKLTSLPIAGVGISKAQRDVIKGFNQNSINYALEPINKTVSSIGHKGIQEADDLAKAAYNNLLPKLNNIQADDIFNTQLKELNTLVQDLPPDRADQFGRILKHQVLDRFTDAGKMSGETMKRVDSQLGKMIRGYSKKAAEDYDVAQLRDALMETQSILRDMVARRHPQYAQQLEAANATWSRLLRVEKAAASQGAREGVFTPAQLRNAASQMSASVINRARGEAQMQPFAETAERLIGNVFPESGTAPRLMIAGGAAGGYGLLAPEVLAGEAALGTAYAIPAIRNALVAAIGKRPAIAPEVANYLRLASPAAGRIGAIGGAAYLGQQ